MRACFIKTGCDDVCSEGRRCLEESLTACTNMVDGATRSHGCRAVGREESFRQSSENREATEATTMTAAGF